MSRDLMYIQFGVISVLLASLVVVSADRAKVAEALESFEERNQRLSGELTEKEIMIQTKDAYILDIEGSVETLTGSLESLEVQLEELTREREKLLR